MLTAEERQEIEAELAHYPTKQSVCIDAMQIIQRHRGWVSDESLKDLAEFLGMSVEDLDGVATFYNLIFRNDEPRGREFPQRQRAVFRSRQSDSAIFALAFR